MIEKSFSFQLIFNLNIDKLSSHSRPADEQKQIISRESFRFWHSYFLALQL